jgi:hypothetical protein
VDCIIGQMAVAIEAKASARITADHVSGLRQLHADHPRARRVVGLRFAEAAEPGTEWRLEVRPDASAAQRQHLQRLVGSAPGSSK